MPLCAYTTQRDYCKLLDPIKKYTRRINRPFSARSVSHAACIIRRSDVLQLHCQYLRRAARANKPLAPDYNDQHQIKPRRPDRSWSGVQAATLTIRCRSAGAKIGYKSCIGTSRCVKIAIMFLSPHLSPTFSPHSSTTANFNASSRSFFPSPPRLFGTNRVTAAAEIAQLVRFSDIILTAPRRHSTCWAMGFSDA